MKQKEVNPENTKVRENLKTEKAEKKNIENLKI